MGFKAFMVVASLVPNIFCAFYPISIDDDLVASLPIVVSGGGGGNNIAPESLCHLQPRVSTFLGLGFCLFKLGRLA
uniref:Secreted protein n=1 Tax=Manihot esculenta TaxID=3983 RepID=A0A2C9V106_MANES